MDKEGRQYLKLKEKEYTVGDLAVGTIQKLWLTCGKQNCKCMKGKKHGPYYYLAYTRTEDRKTSPVCISKDKVPDSGNFNLVFFITPLYNKVLL